MSCAAGNVNEIPEWTEVQGDIRLTPFYSIYQCKEKLQGYVEDLNGKGIGSHHCNTILYVLQDVHVIAIHVF